MIPGVDAYDTLSGAALAAAGRRFAGRYISGTNPLRMPEAADLTEHGIGILALFEQGPAAALGGASSGRQDGYTALRGAMLGSRRTVMPDGAAIVFAVDFDPVAPADRSACLEYWRAAGKFIRPRGFLLGGYGPEDLINGARNESLLDVSMVAGGWRSGTIRSGVQLVQSAVQVVIGGATCDELEATTSHFGAWNLGGLWPPVLAQEGIMRIARSSTGAAFVVDGSRRMPVDGQHWPAIAAQQLPPVEMSDVDLDLLELVPWGTL
ncbi:MAG: DUF1906 domain-containing protein [Actinomycetota bacterium]|nr:DUF1906 domain-containing protein [Actinomycetota bacterium]